MLWQPLKQAVVVKDITLSVHWKQAGLRPLGRYRKMCIYNKNILLQLLLQLVLFCRPYHGLSIEQAFPFKIYLRVCKKCTYDIITSFNMCLPFRLLNIPSDQGLTWHWIYLNQDLLSSYNISAAGLILHVADPEIVSLSKSYSINRFQISNNTNKLLPSVCGDYFPNVSDHQYNSSRTQEK